MKITKEEVYSIAHIARIAVKEKEVEQLAQQLGDILGYAQSVTELAEDVIEQAFDSSTPNQVRSDIVQPSPVQEVMAVAPEIEEGYFVVPKIIENSK